MKKTVHRSKVVPCESPPHHWHTGLSSHTQTSHSIFLHLYLSKWGGRKWTSINHNLYHNHGGRFVTQYWNGLKDKTCNTIRVKRPSKGPTIFSHLGESWVVYVTHEVISVCSSNLPVSLLVHTGKELSVHRDVKQHFIYSCEEKYHQTSFGFPLSS